MNFYVTEDEKRLIDERIRLPPTRSIRQIRTDSFPQHRIHASLYIFLQCLLLRISTLCLLTIKVLKNLLYLPISANIVLIVSYLLIDQQIISYKNQKHFNQFTMSLLFCVILFYRIFLPLYLPLSEFVNTGGTI